MDNSRKSSMWNLFEEMNRDLRVSMHVQDTTVVRGLCQTPELDTVNYRKI